MIVFTFSELVGLAVIGLFLLFSFALFLYGAGKRLCYKMAGFPEVDRTCETAIHCAWYDRGYCTKQDFDCQFNPKRPVSKREAKE